MVGSLPSLDSIDFPKMGEIPLLSTEQLVDLDDSEAVGLLTDQFNEVPIFELITMAAHEVLGDQLTDSPTLYRSIMLDETELIQAELVAKLNWILEEQKIAPPEVLVLQIFGRDASCTGKLNKDEGTFGEYMMGMNFGSTQVINYQNRTIVLKDGQSTSPFRLDLSLKTKNVYPTIPKTTRIVFPDGRATLKPKQYRSYLIWAFWSKDPQANQANEQQQGDFKNLKAMLKKMGDEEDEEKKEGEPSLLHSQSGSKVDSEGVPTTGRTFSV